MVSRRPQQQILGKYIYKLKDGTVGELNVFRDGPKYYLGTHDIHPTNLHTREEGWRQELFLINPNVVAAEYLSTTMYGQTDEVKRKMAEG